MTKLKLTFESPQFERPRHLIWEAAELRVGRSQSADFSVPLKTLSGHHLTFRGREGRYEVADAGSSNGTLLDNVKLEPHRFVPLKAGAVLRTIDLAIQVSLVESYDEQSFTMQTATQAIRHMAHDALGHDGRDQDAYLEVLSGELRGRRYTLDDRIKRAFVGTAQGALIKLHGAHWPERLFEIDRTEAGFAITPSPQVNVHIDDQPVTGRYELRTRQRLSLEGGLEIHFVDPVEELMGALDGVLPPTERVLPGPAPAAPELAAASNEPGAQAPPQQLEADASSLEASRAAEHGGADPGAEPEQSVKASKRSKSSSRLSGVEILIILFILLMVCAAVGVILVFVTS